MIRYSKGTWQTLFYWWGGINRHLLWPNFCYLIFLVCLYLFQHEIEAFQPSVSSGGLHMLGSLTVFLLVFRMNQSMARNNEANDRSDILFNHLERLVQETFTALAGANEDQLGDHLLRPRDCTEEQLEKLRLHADLAAATRINVSRLTLAFAISFLIHCLLLGAVGDHNGDIDEESMTQILFLHSRLQSLLYVEEMELVDASISILFEKNQASADRVFRGEVSRYRVLGTCDEPLMLQGRTETCPHGSAAIPSMPKVVMTMLVEALLMPLNKRWGYPERVLNMVAGTCDDIMAQVTHLGGLIVRPVSLAYYQHCRVILLLYAMLWPIVTELGHDWGDVLDNIVFPFCAFWAMSGLEKLAEMMENPLGNDDTDIHLMEILHDLEVGVQMAFQMSEEHRSKVRRCLNYALKTPIPDFAKDYATRPSLVPPRRFEDYFCWMPIPTVIAEGMLLKHGDATITHAAFFEGHFSEFRQFLRKALRRRSKTGRTRYEALSQDDDSDGDRFDEAPPETTMGVVQRDPSTFWHYLAFKPVLTKSIGQKEVARQAEWRQRVLSCVGKGHSASPLFQASQPEDSERSVILRPLAEEQTQLLGYALKNGVDEGCVVVEMGKSAGAVQLSAKPTSGLKSHANQATKPGEEPQVRFGAMFSNRNSMLPTEPQEALTVKPNPVPSAEPQAGAASSSSGEPSADMQAATILEYHEAPSRDMQLDAHEKLVDSPEKDHSFIQLPLLSVDPCDSGPGAHSSTSPSAAQAGERFSKWPRLRA